MTVYAPYISSYTTRTPYITAAEFQASPTGINVSQLVPRGTQEQNIDALNVAISRASSYIDMFCKQTLAATTDTQSGRFRIQRAGYLRIPVPFSPIIAVNSVKVGFSPSSLTTMPNLSDLWIDRKVVTFPIQTVQLNVGYSSLYSDGRAYVVLEYVNGWANTLLANAVSAGSSTITVDSSLGIQPGVQLTIYDPAHTEVVVVASVSGNVLTLASPVDYAHEAGFNVSALPAAVKQAAVMLTAALIKTRGSEAIVMSQLRQQASSVVPIEDGGFQDVAIAKELLLPFVRTQ